MSDSLDRVFAALSDPTRRAILARLAQGEATVMELAEPLPISQPAVSKHLQVLERAGLVVRSREAQRRPCRLAPAALAEAGRWIDGYRELWDDDLTSLLHDLYPKKKRKKPKREKRK